MEPTKPPTIPLAPLSIGLQDAIAWTTNWRESAKTLKAWSFTFAAEEFAAILQEPGVVKVRLYLALAVSNTNHLIEKLICVGVDEHGNDIINTPENPRAEDVTGTGIYDFSNPCPPLCEAGNKSSPLY